LRNNLNEKTSNSVLNSSKLLDHSADNITVTSIKKIYESGTTSHKNLHSDLLSGKKNHLRMKSMTPLAERMLMDLKSDS
jgi:hypothetical protein